MVIAVNTRFLLKDRLEGYGYFTLETLRLIVQQHPEHEFHFLFDRPYDDSYIFSTNVQPHVLTPAARHPMLWKIWFDFKVPRILKRIKADVFLSPDGFCSLTTKVPQCMVVHDLGFLHFPDAYKKSHNWFYRWYIKKFVQKAKRIATVSELSKKDIISHFKVQPEKIDVVYNAARESFAPISFDEQVAVKARFTAGKEYFIYVGAIHPRKNLLNLLKAFSLFKKRLRSEMKLVLAGRQAWKNDEFLQLLSSYKYKDDVVLTGYVEEKEVVQLIGASYALVYPSLFEGFGVPVMEGMKCKVPVITSKGTSMEEIGEDAALYFDAHDVADIADKLMLIYKDENLRKKLITKGKIVAQKYSWQRTADLLWGCMMKAVNG